MSTVENLSDTPFNFQRIERAYALFSRLDDEQRIVDIDYIAAHTGYSKNTATHYVSKKWWWFLHPQGSGRYQCQGLHLRSKDDFVRLHQQKVLLDEPIIIERYWQMSKGEALALCVLLMVISITWRTQRGWKAR